MKLIHKSGMLLIDKEKSDLLLFLKCLTDNDFIKIVELGSPF